MVNVYVPFGTNSIAIPEYFKLLDQISKLSYNEAIVCGDFNLPSIHWTYDDEIPGILIPDNVNGYLEEEFVTANALLGLSQVLVQPNNRNHLDLVFVSNFDIIYCSEPLIEERFDKPSRFHHPVIINLLIDQNIQDSTFYNYGRTNLKNTRSKLSETEFEIISEKDINIEIWEDNYVASAKIDRNFRKLSDILIGCTPLKSVKRKWTDKHPWLQNNSAYEETKLVKKEAHAIFLRSPSEINKTNYKKACKDNFDAYDNARITYLNKALDETRGTTNDFFKIMKGSPGRDLPPTMNFKDEPFTGARRNEQIASHLSSSFLTDPPSFGRNR